MQVKRFVLGAWCWLLLSAAACWSAEAPSPGERSSASAPPLAAPVGLWREPEARPFGLAARPPLTTSAVYGRPDPPLPFRAAPAFESLKASLPLYLLAEPGTRRMLVVENNGRILSFDEEDPRCVTQVFLEQPGRSFYALTFHPRYRDNRYVFLFSNGSPLEGKRRNRLSRFTVNSAAPHACDPKSERILIEWVSNGHDGGDLAFGKEGMLYATSGDGTTDSDTNVTGQDISDLNSGLLRLDVDHPPTGKMYGIPPDNPFRHLPEARHEIWAFGFRNPWRLHIDPQGTIWCGDVGQDLWEMIEVVERGDNYGWSVQEGGYPFYRDRKVGPAPLKKPAIAHPHSEARSITGGVTYLGRKFPELYGHYVYGDYATGKIWACRWERGAIVQHREIADTPFQIVGFGLDHQGELYFIDYMAAKYYTLERIPVERNPHPFPRKLSDTGLYTDVRHHKLHPSIIPYTVNSPLWSDGAYKDRSMALPGTSRIQFTERGAWKFPERSVLIKSFAFEREPGNPQTREWVETRLLVLEQNEWVGYTYRWNAAQTDADLVEAPGADQVLTIRDPQAVGGIRQQQWHFPSRTECMVCHSRAGGFILGPHTLQMNKSHTYELGADNQIRALVHTGALSIPVAEYLKVLDTEREGQSKKLKPVRDAWSRLAAALSEYGKLLPEWPEPVRRAGITLLRPLSRFRQRAEQLPVRLVAQARDRAQTHPLVDLPFSAAQFGALPAPQDSSASLERRVKAYLHANCAICHVDAGGGNSAIWLGYETPLAQMRMLDTPPLHEKFGITEARVIAPGAPARSVLLARISRRGRGQMPPLGSAQVDAEGIELIRSWIASLPQPVAAPRASEKKPSADSSSALPPSPDTPRAEPADKTQRAGKSVPRKSPVNLPPDKSPGMR